METAVMSSLAYDAGGIPGGQTEGQLSSIHLDKLALAGDGHAYRSRGVVVNIQVTADGTVSLFQVGSDALPGSQLHQGDHGRGGEDIQGAASHGFCGVGFCHQYFLSSFDSSF